MTESNLSFACPYCGHRFTWKPQYANRKLACACGQLLEVTEPPAVETETYDLADEPAPKAAMVESIDPEPGQLSLDSAGQEIPPAKPSRILGYRRMGSAEAHTVPDEVQTRRRDFWTPLGMITVASLFILAAAILLERSTQASVPAVAFNLTLRAGWELAMLLISAMAINFAIDTGLGSFPTAMLKLTAVGLLRFSISTVISPEGNILLAALGFFITFPMLIFWFMYLFEFDFSESMFSSVLVSMMRLISYFGLWKLL